MKNEDKNYHLIYKTTCVVTGKFYIGRHSTNNPNDAYLGSGKMLRNSIKKHGKENHIRVILESLTSLEELIKREEEIVTVNLIVDPHCMNMKLGGEGGNGLVWTDQGKANLSKALKGRKLSKEQRARMKIYLKGINSGRKATNEAKAKMSAAHKGITHTDEAKEKIRAAHLGKIFSQEHKKNIGIASTGRKQTDHAKKRVSETHKGVPLDQEHRKKIADALRGKKKSPEHMKNWHAAIERRRILKNTSLN